MPWVAERLYTDALGSCAYCLQIVYPREMLSGDAAVFFHVSIEAILISFNFWVSKGFRQ